MITAGDADHYYLRTDRRSAKQRCIAGIEKDSHAGEHRIDADIANIPHHASSAGIS